MKIILIGNYRLDRQESMERFAKMLCDGFKSKNVMSEIWRPNIVFGKKSLDPYNGIGKYLGYIDKWFIFPIVLTFRLLNKVKFGKDVYFHVCDHSNAPYLKYLPKNKSGITCHDVLAIRGAFGYEDAYCPSSGMGIILQKWILKYLSRAINLISVSEFTLNQLKDLSKNKKVNINNWGVIHNAFNAPFKPLSKKDSIKVLENTKLNIEKPFILHVGSSLPRKNRKLLIDMLISLGDEWDGDICYAGGKIDKDLLEYAKEMKIENRIISVPGPNHDTLVALYSSCEAFIFPSLSEGFGWPLIEAQACGAPVIASNLPPMPEVSGGSALHCSPQNGKQFAKAFLELKEDTFKKSILEKGFENIKRFSNDKIIQSYIKVYSDIQT